MLVKAMTTPPVGAGALRVTVPVELFPPVTEVGARVSPVIRTGLIVRVAVVEFVPKPAVI